ncbi:hypothetical protein HZH68_002451 [Vespula germanica]|uniref:Uncharacterized protein n=1 Tax=Vespula germanica TaxID=30212 RepID=A0A834NMB1_VESGE|nr:hypothetical protein HZH68_002451 [Vespula germanica]
MELLKEISTLRIEQLDELENIFDYLEDNRNLKDYQGEKSARNEKIVASCIKFAWTPISLEISIPEERHEEKRRKRIEKRVSRSRVNPVDWRLIRRLHSTI